MDGTLTLAVHDFDAIRNTLGLPLGKPILEAIEDLPAPQAKHMIAGATVITGLQTGYPHPQRL